MGTDIHAAIEHRASGEPWKALTTPNPYFGKYDDEPETTARVDFSRDYDLFSILGNVRNGYGFAGVVTGEGFDPVMSDGRGLPEDISKEALEAMSNEHSPTYVTLREILEYDWTLATKKTGIVSGEEFERWDRVKFWTPEPREYCGGISGPSVRMLSPDEMRALVKVAKEANKLQEMLADTYCPVEWGESYAEAGKQVWTVALPPMLKLGKRYGYDNVRLVMDFDS